MEKMNSRWHANKIGLINFWYYDEQEFPFVKGRMLLRGSNGSGKSVTMQSVVPLLLDGNMSPERLDPFGSKDRKMSSYLLEEDDEREERTGYLYLEFKREESDIFLTIGMGIRARRGKQLDKWYFGLSDGRRIGKDFFLYKDTGEKITLSKRELEYRIGNGGKVFERQSDYMEYVNRQIFGFATPEEYKEMIDLLIQLRTPKLSKDFKPSVINDILSDSLQPLSDEDLRPMSEAIENMDTMNMNLKSRQEAKTAAEKIARIYDKYNSQILFEKATAYKTEQEHLKNLKKAEEQRERELEVCQTAVIKAEQEKVHLDAQKESMEKEKESLNRSDALHLKMKEAELKESISDNESKLRDKEKFLQSKEEQYQDTVRKQKEEEGKRDEWEKEIQTSLEEMQADADEMAFEEHVFFQDEFVKNLTETFRFDLHEEQFQQTEQQLKAGLEILGQTVELEKRADEQLKEREGRQREADICQRKVQEAEEVLFTKENEWKEELYRWNSNNRFLKFDGEELRKLASYADGYGEQSDFSIVRQQVADVWLVKRTVIESHLADKRKEETEWKQRLEEKKTELSDWENKKEVEPFRSEAVIRNRKRLDALHIPYQEFYKMLEFQEEMDETECDRLEETLLSMGILDALVVDEQYKDQLLALEDGCEDRYLFAAEHQDGTSLLDILELNENVNDIFTNGRITRILQSIAYGGEGMLSVSKNGTYQMGVLKGTITGTYKAGFIGTKAREKNRQLQIQECHNVIEECERALEELAAEIQKCEEEQRILEQEYHKLPGDDDLKEAYFVLSEQERELVLFKKELLKLEEQLKIITMELQEKKKEAVKIAEKLYLSCNYEVFQRAYEAAVDYRQYLAGLKSLHRLFLSSVERINDLKEYEEELDNDLEQIRYDIRNISRELEKCMAEYQSVTEQLKLTDYEQIKERLDACILWLREYPNRLQDCVMVKTKNEERIHLLEEQKKTTIEEIAASEEKSRYLLKIYESEKELGYVMFPDEREKDAANVAEYLSDLVKDAKKEDTIRDLNRIYFENRGFLNDYQLMQNELFAELDGEAPNGCIQAKRLDISARYQGVRIPFVMLLSHLDEDIKELMGLIKDGDRELFEDILANTVSRKIRSKINNSNAWVEKMNTLMSSMNTSSGLRLSLRWRSRVAEKEDQLDTKELVELLKKDYRLMGEAEAAKLSAHFRSKVEEARQHAKDSGGMMSFYQVMKDTLDYRKWFEFQLFSQKSGERIKELTNSVFGTFSGGEKAMSMYVPLFSAVVAKYQGGFLDAPRLISLDEAFAGVDSRNIRDMFRLMCEFEFDFIMNSQVLWGDCDTLDALAIYQLIRPQNAKFVTVMSYIWNGKKKQMLDNEAEVESHGRKLNWENGS